MARNDLSFDADVMRAIGRRALDRVVEHFVGLRDAGVSRTATRVAMETALREPPPRSPVPFERVLERLDEEVLSNIIHVDHPRFFAFVPGPNNYAGVIADLLASGLNVFAGTWLEGSGPAQIELVTIDWLKELLRFPDSASGLFVSGGSHANLTSLMLAREEKLGDALRDGVAYCSSQTHSSMERAFRVLGLRGEQVVRLEADEKFRLPVAAVEERVRSDRASGKRPFCIVANAGTTNTGAIDPLRELSRLCRREDLWLHVDGAYGAVGALSTRKAHLLEGLELADSLCLDPHKWLFQPFGAGVVLVRDGRLLKKHFQVLPEYLDDVKASGEEVNFCDYGIELTRPFRALKLWMTLQLFGLDAIRAAVDRAITLAEIAEARLRDEGFEIVSPAELAVVAFRWVPEGASEEETDALNRGLVRAVMESGFALLSTTVLSGRVVIRLCPINPRATEDDVAQTVALLKRLAEG